MYIQITTKCNMTCKHCCMNATCQGDDMTLETYKAALTHCDGQITLGGGEPTIHPEFWQFMGLALGAQYNESVWLATNGSMTDTSLALCNMARNGVIGCALSLDEWHDEIDYEVEEAFTDGMTLDREGRWKLGYDAKKGDGREVRNVGIGDGPMKQGRCDWSERIECACNSLTVKPNGDVMLCGCEDSIKIGDVFNSFEVPKNDDGDPIECVADHIADQIYCG